MYGQEAKSARVEGSSRRMSMRRMGFVGDGVLDVVLEDAILLADVGVGDGVDAGAGVLHTILSLLYS